MKRKLSNIDEHLQKAIEYLYQAREARKTFHQRKAIRSARAYINIALKEIAKEDK